MPTIEDLTTPLRREYDRGRIVGRLRDVAAARVDLVAPQAALSAGPTRTAIALAEPLVTDAGVTSNFVFASWTKTAWRNAAARLEIPPSYLDRLVDKGRGVLAATNVNALALADKRAAMYRLLQCDDGFALSAILSDRFSPIDNLDVLTAVSRGMTAADQNLSDCEIDADWTNDRFRMRVAVPQVGLAAADLLAGYKWPFSHRRDRGIHDPATEGEIPPVMWAGLEIGNSETGGGAMTITPRVVVQICRNGLTRPMDVVRSVHLGGRLEKGAVDWSQATQRKALELVTEQIADATRQFVSVAYLEKTADEMRAAKGLPVESPTAAIQVVQQRLGFSDDETAAVLDAFLLGGDSTVLGLGQAVTAAAQTVADGDRQSEMEAAFWQIVQAPQSFVGAA